MSDASRTVYIVDDDAAIRDALKTLMEVSGLSCHCFESAEAFVEQLQPDDMGCLLLDVRMPGMSGVELQQYLIDHKFDLPIVVISGHADVPMAVTMMRKGAIDFFEKPFRNEKLVERIRECLHRIEDKRDSSDRIKQIRSHLERLTRREREVLDGVVAGKASKVIADELGISVKTVDVHRSRIMDKMEVRSIAELIRQVVQV